MSSQIRPNRPEVSDRFPMLGFTIKTDAEARRYEVTLASDPALFRFESKGKRTPSNFYSSRASGLQPVERGEAVYVLPPEVLARFVGQEKLYYALATYGNGQTEAPRIAAVPSEGSAYVNLRGLSGRSLARVRLLPSRQRAAAAYGSGAGNELEWAGDAASPGTVPANAAPANAAPANAAPAAPQTGAAAALAYDDGFGILPEPSTLVPRRTPPARAQSGESFTINWDEVQLVPQPNNVTCWAAAAAMIIGWRDRVSLTPETVAEISGRSTANGLDQNDRRQFAADIGLQSEAPASYAPDGFRTLLENYGPLWVSVQLPGSGHAIVVTGMYDDGSSTYVRVSDPWDRVVGTPGAPGAYLNTHNTGSRYIMSWQDFTREYEDRASSNPAGTVNVQILHAAGTDGRTPNRGTAVGYAMEAAGTDDDDDARGIDGPIPDEESTAAAQGYAGALSDPSEYPQASRFVAASPANYRARRERRTINRVVIHITDGRANINGPISWFRNPAARVSAHYIVGQDGEVVQMVRHNDIAWHAGTANRDSIGIEHVANRGERGLPRLMPTEAEYCASAALVRWLCDTYGIPIDRTHVLGHSEADPRTTHTDCPNSVWDWDYFMRLVQSGTCSPRSEGQAYAAPLTDTPEYPQAARFEPASPANYHSPAGGTRTIDGVVIHITDGPSMRSAINTFQNPRDQKSAHYVVGQDGEVVQMVHENDVAGHAGRATNEHTLGIEHVAQVSPRMAPTEAQYCASAALTRWLCDKYSIPVDRTHIIPHSQVDPTKSCPSSMWDWDYFMGMVQSRSCYSRPQGSGQSLAADALPAPPAPILAHAMDDFINEPFINDAQIQRSIHDTTDINWDLASLSGMKHPNDRVPAQQASVQAATPIDLNDWPYLDVGTSRLRLGLTVRWQYNGRSLGNIMIMPGAAQSVPGHTLRVVASITDDPVVYPRSNPTYAAVRLRIEYTFTQPGNVVRTAITEIHLFGNGTINRTNHWQ